MTLIHGDVGTDNVLVPLADQVDRPIFIIDRQPFNGSLTDFLGAYDVAYATIYNWPTATSRAWERPFLEHYLASLHTFGVTRYGWEQLMVDYRFSCALGVAVAAEYCRSGINRYIDFWFPMLHRSLAACDAHDVPALWR